MRSIILILLISIIIQGCASNNVTANIEADPAMPQDSSFDLSSLTGTTWVAEDIAQRGVIDNLQSSLQILSASQVAGFAGCNSFTGSAQFSPGKVRMSQLASTRKMCPPAIMDQEKKFLAALGAARSARMENGLLYLADEAGTEILRFWERKP
jgi:heat shock protein HslJ